MKKTLCYAVLLGVLAAAAPFAALLFPAPAPEEAPATTPQPSAEIPALTPQPLAEAPLSEDTDFTGDLTLYDAADGQTRTVPVREFLIGGCDPVPDGGQPQLCPFAG